LFIGALLPVSANVINQVRYYYYENNNTYLYVLYYYVGYDTGFGGRKLIGTICNLLTDNLDRQRLVGTMSILANVLMFLLLALFTYRASTVEKNKGATMMMFLAWALSPFSLIGFARCGMSTHFVETYQFALTLGWLLLFIKYRRKRFFHLITIIIAVVCTLVHHTFCCTIFPLFIALLILDSFDLDGHLIPQKTFWVLTNGIILSGLLFAIWNFSNMNISIEELTTRLRGHLGPNEEYILKDGLNAFYYISNSENHQASMTPILNNRLLEIPFYLILTLPILLFTYYPLVSAAKHAGDRRMKWKYRLAYLSITLLTLPIFFVACDYGRWIVGWSFSLFAVTMTAIAIGDRGICDALQRLFSFCKSYWWVLVLFIIYESQLYLNGFEGLEQAIKLRKLTTALLGHAA
jgi:hypothetical protein